MNSYKVPYSDKGAVDTARCASCSAVDLLVLVAVRTPCVRAMAARTPCARGGFLSVCFSLGRWS